MNAQLVLLLVLVFVSVALFIGGVASFTLARSSAGRRRLSQIVQAPAPSVFLQPVETLAEVQAPFWDRLANALPTSRGTVTRLRRELALCGFLGPKTPALFSLTELICPVLLGLPPLLLLTGSNRFLMTAMGAIGGYMLPGLYLRYRTARRRLEIQNGLADALDLFVLCLEAGSSLDQAIVKASDELGVAYPALRDQLHILITEMRAGKPRIEAFRGLADRTRVDDVRSLVAMLVQTDRFGTSIAQALRTHAEVCRTKRRQRAEERAQKVGVKLVFPLVFCLFPALYVVMLGPAYIQFNRVFSGH
jgi:tight adherence protein C